MIDPESSTPMGLSKSNGKRRGTSAPTGSARGAQTLRAMATLGKCTACKEGALADAHGHPFLHPKLGVLLCERCHGRDTRVFEVDVRAPPARARRARPSTAKPRCDAEPPH